jgi:SAM-dependent methyltransferase
MTKKATTQYDAIASAYAETGEMPLKLELELWSCLELLGNIEGQRVLDAACGFGLYSRALKKVGAQRVVGFDVSEKLIAVARAKEAAEPLGVEYLVGDAQALPVIGEFDLVIAPWLFMYAETPEQLETMARNLFVQLVSPGRFVAVVANPAMQVGNRDYSEYGAMVEGPAELTDGSMYRVAIRASSTAPAPVSLQCAFWTGETLERVLRKVGFTSVAWSRPHPSPEGIARYGAAHWAKANEVPPMMMIDCRI